MTWYEHFLHDSFCVWHVLNVGGVDDVIRVFVRIVDTSHVRRLLLSFAANRKSERLGIYT
jgi:hypothetical protein